ncbi:hypothetical protein Micbo1qcDRAFT_42749 [Microdochium bolleyi]|uniref:Uncharacterized protein n=1 Tax=Microdochium bolleyi TaxID=196109 RepID=A0A136JAT1_9PEZI|nr:hypothetical protein Micbo1qcDRAFT_42749 [Microdochium bolleyi]
MGKWWCCRRPRPIHRVHFHGRGKPAPHSDLLIFIRPLFSRLGLLAPGKISTARSSSLSLPYNLPTLPSSSVFS